MNGRTEVVELLLKNGALSDAADEEGKTPLYAASRNGRAGVVKLLLEHGADINAPTRTDGTTALHVACARGNVNVVEVLLEKGADVNSVDTKVSISDQIHFCKCIANFSY